MRCSRNVLGPIQPCGDGWSRNKTDPLSVHAAQCLRPLAASSIRSHSGLLERVLPGLARMPLSSRVAVAPAVEREPTRSVAGMPDGGLRARAAALLGMSGGELRPGLTSFAESFDRVEVFVSPSMCGIFGGFSEGLGAVCASSESAAETRRGALTAPPVHAPVRREGVCCCLHSPCPFSTPDVPLRGAAVHRPGLDKKVSVTDGATPVDRRDVRVCLRPVLTRKRGEHSGSGPSFHTSTSDVRIVSRGHKGSSRTYQSGLRWPEAKSDD